MLSEEFGSVKLNLSPHYSKKDNNSAKTPLLMQLFVVEFDLPTKRALCEGARGSWSSKNVCLPHV